MKFNGILPEGTPMILLLYHTIAFIWRLAYSNHCIHIASTKMRSISMKMEHYAKEKFKHASMHKPVCVRSKGTI